MDISTFTIDVYYVSSIRKFVTYLPRYLALLDSNELMIASKFKQVTYRDNYIICHGILRQLLSKHTGEPPETLQIEKAEFGKPFLLEFPQVSFNISHSGDVLVIAVSLRCQLGVDIECYKQRSTWEGLVKKCFAQEEIDYWYSLDTTERNADFYRIWVRKEAFVKAVGKGISLGLSQCILNPDGLESFLRVPSTLSGLVTDWQVYPLSLPENQFGAVVCNRRNATLNMTRLSRNS